MPDKVPLPQDAIDFLTRKKIVATEAWDDLKWGEHSHAFTVAHSVNADILEDLFGALSEALQQGTTYEAFKKDMKPLMEAKGWYGGRADKVGDEKYLNWRLNTIYDVNLSTAYSAGRYRQMARGSDLRPIWVYSAVLDSNTRAAHRALHGKAFRSDNQFWDSYYPPNGWKCRCTVYSLSEDGAEARGIIVLEAIPLGVDEKDLAPPEWRYNPGKEAYAPDFSKYNYLKKAIAPDGKSILSHVKDAYAASMRESRLGAGEWKTWTNRVLESGYGAQVIPVLAGVAPETTTDEIDPKLMLTDTTIRHGQRQGKQKALPKDDLSALYDTINDPDGIYQEKGRDNEYSFVRRYDDTYAVKAFFRRTMKNASLRLVSYELVKRSEYEQGAGKKYRSVYRK